MELRFIVIVTRMLELVLGAADTDRRWFRSDGSD